MDSPPKTKNYKRQTVPKIVFFGTPELATPILDELKENGFIPSVIVTSPDRPAGRGLKLTPPPVKTWAEKNNILVLQPEKLDSDFIQNLRAKDYDIFIVVAYGKILPKELIDIPRLGTFNLHYSLLPKWRGASPVESSILNGEKETGVSIQKMVFELDAGPIAAEEKTAIGETETAPELRNRLNEIGKKLLIETIKKITAGTAKLREQNHKLATFTKKIKKEDGLIDLNEEPEKNYRKYRAYYGWPGTYFFHNGKRIIIKNAALEKGVFKIKRVIPEGGKELNYDNFLRG